MLDPKNLTLERHGQILPCLVRIHWLQPPTYVMEQFPPTVGPSHFNKDEKPILQAIAHGGQGYGSEYGSGQEGYRPGASNADPTTTASPGTPGDSASPAAASIKTLHKPSANQSATKKAHLQSRSSTEQIKIV